MNFSKHNPVYIIDGCRTPFIKATGIPGEFSASDLAVQAGRKLLLRSVIHASDINEVIMGCASAGPDEANIARVIALRLGCPETIPAWSVQRNCASGMQSIDSAARNIASGDGDLILAGGTEAMSHHPVLLNSSMVRWLGLLQQQKTIMQKIKHLFRLKPYFLKPIIGLLKGLKDPLNGMTMGQTAEQLAWKFAVTREMMDHYAVHSHRSLAIGIEQQVFKDEVIELYSPQGNLFETDDGLRKDSSEKGLSRLKPVFDQKTGAITAGNSAQITDGACLLLLASKKAVSQFHLQPIGKIIDCQWSGLKPTEMGLGPVHAMSAIMQRHQLDSPQIDYWEINEAFAAQILACLAAWQDEIYCQNELKIPSAYSAIDLNRLNIHGGGISLGHPVGASGARIVLHLINVLNQHQAHLGMASLCIGGGQGGAMLIEAIRSHHDAG